MGERPVILRALEAEHRQIATLLGLIERETDRVARGGHLATGLMQSILRYLLLYPDLYHHPKEDLVYATLQRRDRTSAGAIGDLQREHERLAASVRQLAALIERVAVEPRVPHALLATECRAVLDIYRDHILREERDLFPAARRLLDEADWAAVAHAAADRPDPLFGPELDDAFQPIRDALMRRSWLGN